MKIKYIIIWEYDVNDDEMQHILSLRIRKNQTMKSVLKKRLLTRCGLCTVLCSLIFWQAKTLWLLLLLALSWLFILECAINSRALVRQLDIQRSERQTALFFSASTSSSIYKITQNTLGIASTPSAAPQSATDRTQMPLKRIQEANIRMNGATTTWVCLSRKRNAIYHRKMLMAQNHWIEVIFNYFHFSLLSPNVCFSERRWARKDPIVGCAKFNIAADTAKLQSQIRSDSIRHSHHNHYY